MIKPKNVRTFALADRSITFVGRERFQVADAKFKKQILSTGVFKEDAGGLYYAGVLRVPLKSGQRVSVPDSGIVDVASEDVTPGFDYEVVNA